VGLERGPLSLVSTIEELLGRNSSGSGLETEITVAGIRRIDHTTLLYPQKLVLTSPTNAGFSLVITKVKFKVTLRLAVNQSVCLGVGHPFGGP
jgi:hypothetical protein